jgi:hypothetical protein
MKKLIFGTLFLALVGIGTTGCKKEVLNKNSSTVTNSQNNSSQIKSLTGFHSDGKMLIFNTSDDFANFIEFDISKHVDEYSANSKDGQPAFRNIKQELSNEVYTRYSDYIASSNQVDYINDNLLNEVLNKDMIVQIGNYLYRLNKEKEKVFVLSSTYKETDYNDLVSENTSNKKITVYSTEEDVLEMVEAGILSEKVLGCTAPSALHQNSPNTPTAVINQYSSMFACSRYKKYGLSHKLEADVLLTNTNAFNNVQIYIAMENCSYKQRCGTSLTNFSHPWLTPQVLQINSMTKLYRYTIYHSTRALENYNFKIRGRAEDYMNPVGSNPYNVIFTNWAIIFS